MTMPLVDGGIRSETVEIFLSIDVGHPSAFRFVNDNVEGTVVVSAEPSIEM